jgi:quinol monooxygenase YgiN
VWVKMGVFVIACYKPNPGKDADLRALIKTHVPTLRLQDLATNRAAHLMRASDGTYLEVFEWSSKQAAQSAHSNPVVQKLWKDFSELCEFSQLSSLSESQQMFAHFEPVDL